MILTTLFLFTPLAARADEPLQPPIPAAPGAYLQAPTPHRGPAERAIALTPPREHNPAAERTRTPRIGFETVGGVLGLSASAIVGVFGWGFVSVTVCQSLECNFSGALAFGGLAALALVPLGVLVGSTATRGNGGYAWSVLGAALGLVPGAAGGYWIAQETGEMAAAIPLLAALTIFGAVLGYELSADAPPTSVERIFTPVASIDATGFRVGLRATL